MELTRFEVEKLIRRVIVIPDDMQGLWSRRGNYRLVILYTRVFVKLELIKAQSVVSNVGVVDGRARWRGREGLVTEKRN